MSKARKRHHQRWQVGFRRSMREFRRADEARKLGYSPPVKLARFNDMLKAIYPKEIT